MRITWVLADETVLSPDQDIAQLKLIGSSWGSWRTWRAYAIRESLADLPNLTQDTLSKVIELLGS